MDFSQLFEGHFVFFAVLSTLQSTAFAFSHTTYRIFSIWGYYFSLNLGYSPTLFIIPDLLPRATSRTASDLAFCTNRGRRQSCALPFRNKHPSLAILILLCQSMSVYLKSPMNGVLALFHKPFLSALFPDVLSYPALKVYSSFLWFYFTHFYFLLKSKWTWLRKSTGGCNSWFRHLFSPSIVSSSRSISY